MTAPWIARDLRRHAAELRVLARDAIVRSETYDRVARETDELADKLDKDADSIASLRAELKELKESVRRERNRGKAQ